MVDEISGVQTGRGATLLARMPRGARSWASASLARGFRDADAGRLGEIQDSASPEFPRGFSLPLSLALNSATFQRG
jgi:hypothetical protein